MAQITAEEARIRVALANPNMSSVDVRREAERVIATLEAIEAEDAMRTAYAAQQAEEQSERAIEAQRRAEAYSDAASVVRASHPDWGEDSVERAALHLAAENASAIAALNLRDALADGFDKSPALRLPKDERPVGGW